MLRPLFLNDGNCEIWVSHGDSCVLVTTVCDIRMRTCIQRRHVRRLSCILPIFFWSVIHSFLDFRLFYRTCKAVPIQASVFIHHSHLLLGPVVPTDCHPQEHVSATRIYDENWQRALMNTLHLFPVGIHASPRCHPDPASLYVRHTLGNDNGRWSTNVQWSSRPRTLSGSPHSFLLPSFLFHWWLFSNDRNCTCVTCCRWLPPSTFNLHRKCR